MCTGKTLVAASMISKTNKANKVHVVRIYMYIELSCVINLHALVILLPYVRADTTFPLIIHVID